MSAQLIGASSVFGMLVLIWLGAPVAIALIVLSFAGVWLIRGRAEVAASLLGQAASDSIASYEFGVVPLFVLMGLLVSAAGIGRDLFDVANRLLGRLRGGLGVATVAANAVFAAIVGVSIASAAVFAKVAVPQMLRYGYSPRFAAGLVAGSSVLGMLIPPSLLLILYGILTETSIGRLFIAGILPGLLLAGLYAAAILLGAWRLPGWIGAAAGPGASAAAPMPTREILSKLVPVVLLIGGVLGGIYGGVFTPTEAGAVGALAALLLALARRSLSRRSFWGALADAGSVTTAILFLIIAANLYSRMLALSGLPDVLAGWFAEGGLGPWGFLLVYLAVILLLGTLIDSSSIILVMVPLALPIAQGFGLDLVWFGIVTIIAVEIGLLTPPFGISVFVVKGALDDPGITLGDVFRGALPFAGIMLLTLALVIAFPGIATGLL